jgi:hypothetical protein
MTKVTITADHPNSPDTTFRASALQRESVGRSPGAALDALTAQLDEKRAGTLIVVQNLHGDEFFTEAQQQRMEELLVKWRAARQAGNALASEDQSELEALVDAELDGSAQRAAAMVRELRK